MTLRGLIFDVDGTLADTEEIHRRAFNAAFAESGLSWRWSRRLYAQLLKVAGGKERLAFYIDQLALDPAARAARLDDVAALHASKTRHFCASLARREKTLRAGVPRILSEAREAGLKLGIASTTTRANIEALLGRAVLRGFDAIACGDLVSRKKPAPDVYLLALGEMGLTAAQCVAFEDSAVGVAAARAAGIFTIASPTLWTAEDDLSGAALVVAEFEDLGGLDAIADRHARWLAQNSEAA
ncbi:MAG: HAD-IA family hydrolase [Pseudorhodoplanes sp.]|nr:HAD-IA family hydrolase [Pseudorhodoplanes sp.]